MAPLSDVFFLSPWRFLDCSFAAIRDPEANKTLQLTPSRIALSFADKAVFLFPQPAMFAQPMIGAAELGVGLQYYDLGILALEKRVT